MTEVKLMNENKVRKKIKAFIASNGTTLKEVVQLMNEKYPDNPITAQNITNKLARETIKFTEVMEIAEVLGYSLEFIPQKGRKYYISDDEEKHGINMFMDIDDENIIAIPGENFGTIVVAGVNATAAVQWLQPQIKGASRSREILLENEARRRFDVIVHATNDHIR